MVMFETVAPALTLYLPFILIYIPVTVFLLLMHAVSRCILAPRIRHIYVVCMICRSTHCRSRSPYADARYATRTQCCESAFNVQRPNSTKLNTPGRPLKSSVFLLAGVWLAGRCNRSRNAYLQLPVHFRIGRWQHVSLLCSLLLFRWKNTITLLQTEGSIHVFVFIFESVFHSIIWCPILKWTGICKYAARTMPTDSSETYTFTCLLHCSFWTSQGSVSSWISSEL